MNRQFIRKLTRMRQVIKGKLRYLSDRDSKLSETLTYKLELLNCMIAEYKFK